jgi:hypothetical protein
MRAAVPAVLGVVLLAGGAWADDGASSRSSASSSDSAASPAVAASPVPAAAPVVRPAGPPAPGPKSLNLGAYRSVNADDPAALVEDLHFQEQVEVRGKAMDARSLTIKMAWWMKDFEPTRGATPSSMSAPSVREMRNYRVHPADSLDLVPALQWLTDKLSGKKKEE